MERWATVKRIHQGALDRAAPERAAFLDEACAGDAALRRDVESLLAYDIQAESFMESPALDVVASDTDESVSVPLAGRTLGHYRVESLIGAGGMGEVYLARDPRLDRAVALKILPPDLALDADRMQRFSREAKAASALNHPNVATVHDIGESGGVHFIVMEYVEGRTLADTIANGPMSAADIIEIGVQVADALDAAHAKGITHRDIKPANLMLTRRGQVKVLDFGIAKTGRTEDSSPDTETAAAAQTAVGLVIGSVPYMSPEQVLGHAVDPRSDLFSLGVTLYELATGRHPFAGTTATETMDRILHASPPPMAALNPAISPELEEITIKCLEKHVNDRYQSARDLLADLRRQHGAADRTPFPQNELKRHNLPAQLTSFVGRRKEIDEIRQLLSTNRLLTLTGAGGCGKTRLALHVASAVLVRFPEGVWLADLGPLSEPSLIPQTVAAALGVREGPGRSLRDALREYVGPRNLLLVLDNCEHLIAACADLVEPLLREAPGLHVLATSREGLGIAGETIWRVPSMSVPAPAEPLTREALEHCEAARLFADRAAAVAPAFAITGDNAASVAAICCRLDGIPLAIELAAARLNVLSVDQIDVRLNDRFRLLTGGSRTAVARQRTLEATIDWSYDLLSESERTLLCRLSVFPGSWTFEAAEEVCAGGGIDREQMLDLISRLVDKSLVNVEDVARGDRRYRCLETVRQYGRERMVRSEDAERVRERHLQFFLAFARRAEPELVRSDQALWLKRLQTEYDNLRSALEWCLETAGHGQTGLELATVLSWFWIKRAYVFEGRKWLDRALTAASGASPRLQARALNLYGLLTISQGDHSAASSVLARALALAREAGDQAEIAWSLGFQALVALYSGEIAESARLAVASRAAAIESGELSRQGPALACLAHQAVSEGNYARAFQLTAEALVLFRATGEKYVEGWHLIDLAHFQLLAGDYVEACDSSLELIHLFSELADSISAAYGLAILAGAHAAQGHLARGIRLWGAMEALLDATGSRLWNIYSESIGDRWINPAKEVLGEDAFRAALSEGRGMSFSQALHYAMTDDRAISDRTDTNGA
jgi:predicted ATPase/serine/threonine protein kinase